MLFALSRRVNNTLNVMSAEMTMTKPESASSGELFLPFERRSRARTSPLVHQICQCIAVAVLAMASYFVISHFLLQSVKVVGRSMTPTLGDSQRYLLNRWIFYVRPPQRTEVVVLRDLIDNGFVVKRIVGLPGDSVFLKQGKVYVNGQLLSEPYLPPGTPTFTYSHLNEQTFKCASDQYFVLGDNRMNSADSRTYGPVPRHNILGLIIR
jgi:signal peptidase I